jgi:diguanylate cyclase (GGDEF)-like protein
MYIVYHMDDGRNVALFGCFIVFLFGIFRLNAREFTVVTLYTLAAYAVVINLLMHLRPQAIHDVPYEWVSWLGLAALLPCFTLIGGQINTLRRKLRESEVRFRSLTEMSSDFYWESDTEHRFTHRASADKKLSTVPVFRQGAHHDSLTGLPNRLLFNDRLNQAISLAKRDSRQFALLYLDLDKFKPVNDTLGHTAGDELLKGVGARIRHQVRESDTVARVGGDEFTVILPDIARHEEAETVAKKIIAALAAPFQLGSQKQSVDIGTSIGIAVYPADAQDTDALIKAADAAMYSAKQMGSSFRFCAT